MIRHLSVPSRMSEAFVATKSTLKSPAHSNLAGRQRSPSLNGFIICEMSYSALFMSAKLARLVVK